MEDLCAGDGGSGRDAHISPQLLHRTSKELIRRVEGERGRGRKEVGGKGKREGGRGSEGGKEGYRFSRDL